MSRFEWDGDGDGPDFANAGAFFETRAAMAIYSRRGRKALRELREALLHLPKRELIEGAVCRRTPEEDEDGEPIEAPEPVVFPGQLAMDGSEVLTPVTSTGLPPRVEGVCAIGAWTWWQKVKAGTDPAKAFEELPALDANDEWSAEGGEMFETAWLGQKHGLTFPLAWELASANDETFASKTPAERWQAFMDWIDKVLASPPLKRGEVRERIGHSYTY
jgi:hypothetical protein